MEILFHGGVLRLLITALIIAMTTPPVFSQPDLPSEASATLVIYNNQDPESAALANFYIKARGIPVSNRVGLACSLGETITRAEYKSTIEKPLRTLFEKKGWWKIRKSQSPSVPDQITETKIRFVALIRGMPLRISPDAHMASAGSVLRGIPSQMQGRNEASVDSEIAALGWFESNRNGMVPNPYFMATAPIMSGVEPSLLLVSRLDAPTVSAVKRLVTDSIAVEKTGLAGFAYIDTRSIQEAGYKIGDEWMLASAPLLWQVGMPVIEDRKPALFPADYPMEDAAFYLGWYRHHVTAPFNRPEFRFRPGAVTCHVHSFSAETIRDPQKGWVAPLIMAGASASMGNVYEPYLGLTVHLNIFTQRLTSGATFAESAYAGLPALSWMTVMVGDPLYRPFAELKGRPPSTLEEPWRAIVSGVKAWFGGETVGAIALLKNAAESEKDPRPLEVLGLLERDSGRQSEAINTWQTAANMANANSTNASARRALLHQIETLAGEGAPGLEAATTLIRKTISAETDKASPFALLLRQIEFALEPPAPRVPGSTPLPGGSLLR